MGVCVCDDLNNSMCVLNVNLPLISHMRAPPCVSYGNMAVIILTALCRVTFRCVRCVHVVTSVALY